MTEADKIKQQLKAFITSAAAVAEAIRALKAVPSGELYARVMVYMEIGTYQRIIDTLVNSKLIRNDNHLLVWIGPDAGLPPTEVKGADDASHQ